MVDTQSHHRHQQYPDRSSDFFRNVNIQFLVHELKGPLDVIETNIRMLLELQNNLGRLNSSQQKVLRRAMRSAAKLRNIVHSLLEVGRSGVGYVSLQRFNVVQCAIEALTEAIEAVTCTHIKETKATTDSYSYMEANGIYLSISPEIENVCLRQDKTKVMFILGNLIRNSLDHKKSKVMVQLKLKEKNLLITISDDGPGVSPDNLESLFQCYKNTKKQTSHSRGKGHGLGLASSRILARYLGGNIDFDDQFTEGARFLLSLPLKFDDQVAIEQGIDVNYSES